VLDLVGRKPTFVQRDFLAFSRALATISRVMSTPMMSPSSAKMAGNRLERAARP
jgi:hypothetical protein